MKFGICSDAERNPRVARMHPMNFDPEQRRRALQAFMDRERIKVSPWEKAADLGGGTLRKFLDGTTDTLTDRTYAKLAAGAAALKGRPIRAQALQEITDGLHDRVNSTESPSLSTATRATVDERQKIESAPPRPAPPKEELPGIPVMGTSLAGREGDFQLNSGEPVDHVRRPTHLKDRKGLFCLWVSGTSMQPWKRPGQLVFLDPNRQPQINDHVVVEMKPTPPDEDRPAYIKLLVRRSATKLTLLQYEPKRTIEIDMRRVNRILRVMPEEEVYPLYS